MDKLFVGIDVGSRDNAVHIMLSDGAKHSSFSAQNNLDGTQAISKNVVSAMAEKGLKSLEIGIEATGVYGDGLMCFLNEDGAIGQFDRRLYILNPKQVEKFKQAYSDLPKNDSVDAFVIAEAGDVNRFTKGQAGLAKYAGLAWNESKSGTFEGQNTRMIKSGNRFLKYYLCEAAMSLVCCDAEYRRYYDLKYKEVNKYQHKPHSL